MQGPQGGERNDDKVEEQARSGNTTVPTDHSEADLVSTWETHDNAGESSSSNDSKVIDFNPPSRESINLTPIPRADSKAKGPLQSLSKIWNRRKVTDVADKTPAQESRGGGAVCESEPVTGKGGTGGGGWGRRASGPTGASTTPLVASKMWRKQRSVEFPGTAPSTAPSSGTLDDYSPEFVEVDGVIGGEYNDRSPGGNETIGQPSALPKLLPERWSTETTNSFGGLGDCDDAGGGGGGAKSSQGDHDDKVGGVGVGAVDGTGSVIADAGGGDPAVVDITSAPFFVARISGVGAELKDVKWSVKQTHFPHLKTAGSLEATVSGLTIELELDTQDLPQAGCSLTSGRSGGRGLRGRRVMTDAAKQRAAKSCIGDTPRGLRLSRLNVSVHAVKVHVSHSALSSVYNLAATTFEAAVKRYVVESVEAAVRKSMVALLGMVNTQVSEKWDLLRSVGGGAGGTSAQASDGGSGNSSAGAGMGGGGNAVDKVFAASLSHRVLWAPPSQQQKQQQQHSSPVSRVPLSPAGNNTNDGMITNDNSTTSTINAPDGNDSNTNGAGILSGQRDKGRPLSARVDILESDSTASGWVNSSSTDCEQVTRGEGPEAVTYGGSADSSGGGSSHGSGAGGSVGSSDGTPPSTSRERLSKRLFRKRLLGAVGGRPTPPVEQAPAKRSFGSETAAFEYSVLRNITTATPVAAVAAPTAATTTTPISFRDRGGMRSSSRDAQQAAAAATVALKMLEKEDSRATAAAGRGGRENHASLDARRLPPPPPPPARRGRIRTRSSIPSVDSSKRRSSLNEGATDSVGKESLGRGRRRLRGTPLGNERSASLNVQSVPWGGGGRSAGERIGIKSHRFEMSPY